MVAVLRGDNAAFSVKLYGFSFTIIPGERRNTGRLAWKIWP